MRLFQCACISLGFFPPRAASASERCLETFTSNWSRLSYTEKVERLDQLRRDCIARIYEATEARPLPDLEFFVDSFHRKARRVQRFRGRNNLLLFRRFEKHFFALERENGFQFFGYNESWMGHALASPGFFQASRSDSPSSLIFDYRPDFETMISSDELERWDGLTWPRAKNNHGNLIFGDLIDAVHSVTEDAVVGATINANTRKTKAHFLLLRQPE